MKRVILSGYDFCYMSRKFWVIGLILMSTGCQYLPSSSFTVEEDSVESWETLSINRFANILNSARAEKRSWVNNPSLFAYHLLNLSDSQRYHIDYQAMQAENNTESLITIVRDGFKDDAIRGDVHQINVQKQDGLWWVVSVKRAFSCWRGPQAYYSSKLCP